MMGLHQNNWLMLFRHKDYLIRKIVEKNKQVKLVVEESPKTR
jgi:hypothetical protein